MSEFASDIKRALGITLGVSASAAALTALVSTGYQQVGPREVSEEERTGQIACYEQRPPLTPLEAGYIGGIIGLISVGGSTITPAWLKHRTPQGIPEQPEL